MATHSPHMDLYSGMMGTLSETMGVSSEMMVNSTTGIRSSKMITARLAFTLLVLSFAALEVKAGMQNVTVKGTVLCNKKRVPNVSVILYERDTFNFDDKLASIHTDEMGEFELYGEEDEANTIRPFIRIHHTCNVKPACKRISEYVVPEDKVGSTFDMKYIALEIHASEDKLKCP
uniref:Transthyretin-like protein 46 n=2 Tax=Caenorhabditis japonica TaxID=281687 RepID=A0A8R1EJI7_CAEJA